MHTVDGASARAYSEAMKHIQLTIIIGAIVGALVAGIILLRTAPDPLETPTPVAIPDCDGTLQAVVLQYNPEAGDISAPVYRELISRLPRRVTIYVVCTEPNAFGHLLFHAELPETRPTPLFFQHEMSTWSRDRWVAMTDDQGTVTILAPRGEQGANLWPQRAGDAKIARELGLVIDDLQVKTSTLYFDGGDIVVDDQRAFVTPAVATRNIQKTVETREELLEALHAELGRPVVLLDVAPPHHAGMFMMPIGDNRVMVGDPKLAAAIMGVEEFETLLPDGADFRIETIDQFDAVAEQVEASGAQVIRMPVVSSPDGRSYLAYLNVILDQRNGQRTVYLPVYQGAEPLNAMATQIWTEAGFTVVPIDCTSAYRHGGSLRCLVNVLQRK